MSKFNKADESGHKPLTVAALKYDHGKDNAPCVIAAGTGYAAERILKTAMENGIAIYQDDSAATLLSGLNLGQEIPIELYQIVVNIYMQLLETAEEQKESI